MAISSPLLEASIDGAHGVLLSIAGGSDLGLFEVSAAAQLIEQAAHDEANIIFGTVIDDALGDEVRITVIAAGFDGGQPQRRPQQQRQAPKPPQKQSQPQPQQPRPVEQQEQTNPGQPSGNARQADPMPGQPSFQQPQQAPQQQRPQFDDDLDVPDFMK